MYQFSFPTRMILGEGALDEMSDAMERQGHRRPLVVSDPTLQDLGLVARLTATLESHGLQSNTFTEVHPNPLQEDCEKGIQCFADNGCDSLIALGGGSAMDVAKTLRILASHPGPLAQYEEARGGDRLIVNPMPPLYAIPTTAGTGSEVGRAAVVILRETSRKSIIFHPDLMPTIAVLQPSLTLGLPVALTAATGIDALTHAMEAYFAPDFHPICDGIALQAMQLVVEYLPRACADGSDLDAREKMLLAASMGAIAFQKGLGMVHSLAHPLSAEYGTHHGLANALLLPDSLALIEQRVRHADQKQRIRDTQRIFRKADLAAESLAGSVRLLIDNIGIQMGLEAQSIPARDLPRLAELAFADGIHRTNMVPVTRDDLLRVYQNAL
jgi:alcohol dehydrogenase class IV|tara:strand:+ start:3388 stop:4539 length:1152 start_codon:yes stop_codon:yes gene_type:complete